MPLRTGHYRRPAGLFASAAEVFQTYRRRAGGFPIYCIIQDGAVIHCTFAEAGHQRAVLRLSEFFADPVVEPGTDQRVGRDFEDYFRGRRRKMPLPSSPFLQAGTEFQQRVWELIAAIPYGETMTYGDLARALKNPLAVRAVGQACNANPLALVIPCHRVVGARNIGGFAGGTELKRLLLAMEIRRQGRSG